MKSDWLKAIKILKNDGIGIMPTDTLYGLVGSAFSKKAVEKNYKIKKRNKNKPLIVLISSISDLKKFNINKKFPILKKVWPGKVSVILPCSSLKFKYLHRGTESIAFRLPAKKSLIKILKETGPLTAPSANPEKLKPAKSIIQAKKYFGNKVDFYLSEGVLKSKPSTLISIDKREKIKVLRGMLK
jgi:L-threonylcarbamoyladenylate synthase